MLLRKHLQPKFCEELLLIWLSRDIPERSRVMIIFSTVSYTHCSLLRRTDKPNKKYDPDLDNSCRKFSSPPRN